jgi:hypothetical protein
VHDRYTDDVGQFLKVALMRWLSSPSPYGLTHRLGVIWLQEPGGHHRLDGDHLAYLHPSHDAGEEFRSLDPDLYDRLRLMAAQSGRPVSIRETCRALPMDSVRFDRPLSFGDLLRDDHDHAARAVARQRWFHEAMVAVSPCSLVFLDSEDGVVGEVEQQASGDATDTGISMSEVGRLLERGQSVVTHHLADPSQPLPELAKAHLNAIHDAVRVEPFVLVRRAEDCTRMFTVIPHTRHRSDMQDRIGALQLSRWGNEFRLYRWRSTLVSA